MLARTAATLALIAATLAGACTRHSVTIATETSTLTAPDGYALTRYRLMDWDDGKPRFATPRGVLYYIQGSSDDTALNATDRLAAAAAMGLDIAMVERRGVTAKGLTNPPDADRYATKATRVADTVRLIEADQGRRSAAGDLPPLPAGAPVILCGASEGGDVAAAAVRPCITHLVLLGVGGGMTQADELLAAWPSLPRALNIRSRDDLEAVFAAVRADPDSDQRWYGHTYRRWASYAFDRPADDLLTLDIPILLIHGAADASVPVASARATRDAFARAGKTNLTYLEYDGADHTFSRADGSSAFPRVEADLVAWLRDTGAIPPAEADRFIRRIRAAHPEAFRERPAGTLDPTRATQ